MHQTDRKEAMRSEAEASGHEEQTKQLGPAATLRGKWWTKEMRYNYAYFFSISSYLLLTDVLSTTYGTGTLSHQSNPLIAVALFLIGLITFALDCTVVPLAGWALGIFIFLILDNKVSQFSFLYRSELFLLIIAPISAAYLLIRVLGARRS